jgi:hypothetical protein
MLNPSKNCAPTFCEGPIDFFSYSFYYAILPGTAGPTIRGIPGILVNSGISSSCCKIIVTAVSRFPDLDFPTVDVLISGLFFLKLQTTEAAF